ncbi:MAG: serine/threonine protein kinase [Pseudomonadales bacterium]|nr:serine/threonine protein kinase [Pseudomonadales bacterium]
MIARPGDGNDTVCIVPTKLDNPKTMAKHIAEVGVNSCIKSRFELLEVLGIGGMGVVYRVRDLRQKELGEKNPYLALKLLNDQLSSNEAALVALQQECKKTQLLSHPNIVNVYDFDRDGDLVYLTMECLYGKSLDQVVYDPGFQGMSLGELEPWIKSMGAALVFAHQNNIVHSDLKPSNIFVTDNNNIKIFDFGIARALETSTYKLKQMGLSALTPAFASLGMLEDDDPKPSDDLYAFAIVIYLLLTGRHPYGKKDARIVHSEKLLPTKPKSMAEASWRVLEQALNPEFGAKLSISEFLEKIVPEKRKRSQPLMWAAVIFCCVSLIGGSLFLKEYIEDAALIKELSSPNLERIESALTQLNRYPLERRVSLLAASRVALIDNVMKWSEEKIYNNELSEALYVCELLLEKYADSQLLGDLKKRLTNKIHVVGENTAATILETEYWLLSVSNSPRERWFKALLALKKIQPQHPLLSEQRVLEKITTMVHVSLYQGQLSKAQDLIDNFYQLYPAAKKNTGLEELVAGYELENNTQLSSLLTNNSMPTINAWSNELVEKATSMRNSDNVSRYQIEALLKEIGAQDAEFSKALRWSMYKHFNVAGEKER